MRLPLPITIQSSGGGSGHESYITTDNSEVRLNVNNLLSSITMKTSNATAVYVDSNQLVGIGTSNPVSKLTINDVNGTCLELVYNDTSRRAYIGVNSEGSLELRTYNNAIDFIDNDLYINQKIIYGGTLITATADQLNFNNVVAGTASSNKSLVLNNNKNIVGINSLSATTLGGTLSTSYQPNISSVNILNITSQYGLSLEGTNVVASATQLNYNSVIPGTASASKSLVLDSQSSISGITSISSTYLLGTIQTASQPNITSLGTLTNLVASGNVGINTNSPSAALEINDSSGNCLRLTYNSDKYGTIAIDSGGSFHFNPSGTAIVIKNNTNLTFSGTSVIQGLNALTATSLTGTLLTESQPNITAIGTLSSLNVNGNVGINNSSPNAQLEINSLSGNCLRISYGPSSTSTQHVDLSVDATGNFYITPTGNNINLPNNKSIRFGGTGTLIGIDALSVNSISGTMQTNAQPNITSVGTLSSLSASGAISSSTSISAPLVTGTLQTTAQPNITSLGILTGLNVNGNIINVQTLSATSINGTLLTNAQPNITSLGELSELAVNGPITKVTSITADKLYGVIQTAAQPNITSLGNLTSLYVSGTLSGVTTLTATSIVGQLTTASQPNITSVGTLNGLSINGNITGVTSLVATNLSGTIQTSSQPNITTLGTLGSLSVTNKITSGSLETGNITGTLQTVSQPNITALGTLSSLNINGSLGLGTITPNKKLEIYESNGDCLRLSRQSVYTDITIDSLGSLLISPTGPSITIGASTNFILSSCNISGVNALTATTVTGTLQTASQPKITALGVITNLKVNGYIGLNTVSPNSQAEFYSETGVCMRLSTIDNYCNFNLITNGLQISPSKSNIILSDNTNLNFGGTGTIVGIQSLSVINLGGTLSTASQPNVTSLGQLTGLVTLGSIGVYTTNPFASVEINNATGSCLRLSYDASNGDASSFVDFTVSSSGNLRIGPSGDSIIIGTNKNIVFAGTGTITGITTFNATYLGGLLTTAAQTNITSLGTLSRLQVNGAIGINVATPSGSFEVNSITGNCMRISKLDSYCDFTINGDGNTVIGPSGTSSVLTRQLFVGSSAGSVMPLEVGYTAYNMSGQYAYNNNLNSHGTVSAGNASIYNYSIRTAGRILAAGSVDIASDRRVKKFIEILPIEYCNKFIRNAQPVSFYWKNGDSQISLGYIAQDLIKLGFPDLVSRTSEPGIMLDIDKDGFISPQDIKFNISYDHIIPIIATVQKRSLVDIDTLQGEVSDLKQELKAMKFQMQEIQQLLAGYKNNTILNV